MSDPIETAYKQKMNDLARVLDELFNGTTRPRKVCFTLLIAEFGENKRCNYISNGNREDIISMMKETIGRFEGRADHKPGRA